MIHAEELEASNVTMGGAVGNGVGIEREGAAREKTERETTVTGGDKMEGLLRCVW